MISLHPASGNVQMSSCCDRIMSLSMGDENSRVFRSLKLVKVVRMVRLLRLFRLLKMARFRLLTEEFMEVCSTRSGMVPS